METTERKIIISKKKNEFQLFLPGGWLIDRWKMSHIRYCLCTHDLTSLTSWLLLSLLSQHGLDGITSFKTCPVTRHRCLLQHILLLLWSFVSTHDYEVRRPNSPFHFFENLSSKTSSHKMYKLRFSTSLSLSILFYSCVHGEPNKIV